MVIMIMKEWVEKGKENGKKYMKREWGTAIKDSEKRRMRKIEIVRMKKRR